MKALLSSVVLVATSLATPVSAGLHDFTPSNARPSAPTVSRNSVIPSSVQGNCFKTRDQSRVCYMQIKKGVYFASIHDVDTPAYPIAMAINCDSGQWGAYGMTLTKRQGDVWARGFCESL